MFYLNRNEEAAKVYASIIIAIFKILKLIAALISTIISIKYGIKGQMDIAIYLLEFAILLNC